MEELYGTLGERALHELGYAHSGFGPYHHQYEDFTLEDFKSQYGFMFPEYSDQEERMVEKRYDTKRDQARESFALWEEQTLGMKNLQQDMLEARTEMKTGHLNRLSDIELNAHKHQQNLLLEQMKAKKDITMNKIARTGIRSGDLKQIKENTMNEISNKIQASNLTRKNIHDSRDRALEDLTINAQQAIDMADTRYQAQYNIKDTDFTNALEMLQLDETDAINKIRDDYQKRILSGMTKVFQNIPGLPPEEEAAEQLIESTVGEVIEDVATGDEQGLGHRIACLVIPHPFKPASCN